MATAVQKQRTVAAPKTVPVIAFDLGNRKVAATDGDKIIHFPSYSDRRSARQDLDYSAISFLENKSFGLEIGATAYCVGKIAFDLNAQPTFSGDKWRKVREFLFPALVALGLESGTTISTLRCSVPDDQSPEQRAPFEALAGREHSFVCNGRDYAIAIDRVAMVAEGKTAWYRASREGMFSCPSLRNGVLDLGGGTAIARLITPEGMIDRSREKVLSGGTSQLAQMIAGELNRNGIEGLILDAIADNSFSVYDLNFKAIYDSLLPVWVDGIKAEMRKAWSPINDQYGQILVVGGSTPIFAPFVKDNPRYVIAPNPQFFALEAMQRG